MRNPSGEEGLLKVRSRRTSRFGHLNSQCSSACGFFLHSGHAVSAAGIINAQRTDMCLDCRRAKRMAFAQLEVAMQFAF